MSGEIKVEQSPNYRTINVAGLIGMHYPSGFDLVFYSEDFDCTEPLSTLQIDVNKLSAKRVIECRLTLEPSVAKAVQNNLNSIISKYEEKFGKITSNNLVGTKQDTKNAISSDENPLAQ
jgi:hypothetical protein